MSPSASPVSSRTWKTWQRGCACSQTCGSPPPTRPCGPPPRPESPTSARRSLSPTSASGTGTLSNSSSSHPRGLGSRGFGQGSLSNLRLSMSCDWPDLLTLHSGELEADADSRTEYHMWHTFLSADTAAWAERFCSAGGGGDYSRQGWTWRLLAEPPPAAPPEASPSSSMKSRFAPITADAVTWNAHIAARRPPPCGGHACPRCTPGGPAPPRLMLQPPRGEIPDREPLVRRPRPPAPAAAGGQEGYGVGTDDGGARAAHRPRLGHPPPRVS
mmetsp:Transcript_18694/g.47159  ORF Transcript_18694/g.47159 Transcript_18694/m.47159 type:complete len:272 (+) Transcript_18694:291-1106(+)